MVGGLGFDGNARKRFEFSEIIAGDHLAGLKNLTKKEVEKAGLRGDPSQLAVYTSASGGGIRKIPWGEADGATKDVGEINIGRNFKITSVSYHSVNKTGTVPGTAFRKNKETSIIDEREISLSLVEMPGVEYGGYISQASINQALSKALTSPQLSPIELFEVGLVDGQGFVGRGVIKPNLPFIKGDTTIDLVIDGAGARIQKTFTSGEIDVPKPFSISDSSLTIAFGTAGFQLGGQVNFGVDKVGKGQVAGFIGSDGKYAVKGKFDFDSQLFDPADVEVKYENGEFSITGNIGISAEKVKGIKKATVAVSYAQGTLKASGQATLDIKGVEDGPV